MILLSPFSPYSEDFVIFAFVRKGGDRGTGRLMTNLAEDHISLLANAEQKGACVYWWNAGLLFMGNKIERMDKGAVFGLEFPIPCGPLLLISASGSNIVFGLSK